MTSQEKKARLAQYRAAEREEARLTQEIERWRARGERMTPRYGPGTQGGGDGRGLEHTVERLDELTGQLIRQRETLIRLRRQLGAAIDTVPDSRLRELLRLRYIEGLTWEQIAVRMELSYQWVCILHGKALQQIKFEGLDRN